MGYGASEYVVESGMQISSSPLAVRGKILNTPEVHMAMSVVSSPLSLKIPAS